MSLYGFSRIDEKNLFLRIIDVSGIGPKMAMQILSGYDLKTLTVAIASGDIKTLSKIKGLGKKTAELLVVNLRDHVADDITLLTMDSPSGSTPIVGEDVADAARVLESLGLAKTEAVKKATEAAKHVSGAENIIAYCLKQL